MRLRHLLPCLILMSASVFGASPEEILKKLPAEITGYKSFDLKKFPLPGLGAARYYGIGDLTLSVYVYDMDKQNIGESIDDPVLKSALDMAAFEIKMLAKEGDYKDLEERDFGRTNFGLKYEVLRGRYRYTKEGGPLSSDIYVFGAQKHIVKIRATASRSNEAKIRSAVERFIPALMDQLRKKP